DRLLQRLVGALGRTVLRRARRARAHEHAALRGHVLVARLPGAGRVRAHRAVRLSERGIELVVGRPAPGEPQRRARGEPRPSKHPPCPSHLRPPPPHPGLSETPRSRPRRRSRGRRRSRSPRGSAARSPPSLSSAWAAARKNTCPRPPPRPPPPRPA